MNHLILALTCVIFIEAVTEILVESVLFQGLRLRLIGDVERPRMVGILFSCPWCMSVWLGILTSASLKFAPLGNDIHWAVQSIALGFVLARFSNLWHSLVVLLWRGSKGWWGRRVGESS